MNTVALDSPFFPRPISAPGRNVAALHSLMQDWEREEAVEEEESETDLMVMLSGMVSSSATALGDE